MAEYRIWTMADLLSVPVELRNDCLKELGYALALHELAWGDKAAEMLTAVLWRDDGKREYTLTDPDGKEYLSMKVSGGEGD